MIPNEILGKWWKAFGDSYETLRRVLRKTGPDGKSNAEAVVQAMIDPAKRRSLETIRMVLRRVGARAKIIVEF